MDNVFFDLVIVRDDAIGDYILWHDALGAYRDQFKGKRVLLICDVRIKELAEQETLFTQVWGYNRKKMIHSFKYAISFLKKLHSVKATTLFYPTWTQHVIGDTFVFSIRAKEKIGMVGNAGDNYFSWKTVVRKLSYNMFSRLISPPETENEIRVIEHFTREVVSPHYKYGYYSLAAIEKDFNLPSKYVVLSLSASNPYRVWNMDNFAAVVDQIPSDYSIVLSGVGDDDVDRAAIIKNKVNNKGRLIDMVNKTSVAEMVALISKAAFVIGNDSAAVHIAAATRVPSICVFHGAHFNRFLPYPEDLPDSFYNPRAVYYKLDCYGCSYQCNKPIEGSYYCLKKVSVQMVISELEKLLNDINIK